MSVLFRQVLWTTALVSVCGSAMEFRVDLAMQTGSPFDWMWVATGAAISIVGCVAMWRMKGSRHAPSDAL